MENLPSAARPMSLAKSVKGGIVYGLCDLRDGVIVYVGQTKNAHKRFESYRAGKCHNPRVNDWINATGRELGFFVLADNPADINASERDWVQKLPNLFNVTMGGEYAWAKHVSQPWMAGTGYRCPSSMAMNHLKVNSKMELPKSFFDGINEARKKMSVKERCLFEIEVCKDLMAASSNWSNQLNKWLDITQDKLIMALEA